MSELTPDRALQAVQAAAEVAESATREAREAADAALGYAGQLADAAGASVPGGIGGAIDPLVFQLSIFALAIFVGYYVVWSVTPALHTPLMSVTNAISSVIVVGALLAVSVGFADAVDAGGNSWARSLGFVAVVLAAVNIFGGFLVTQRMLAMYRKKTK